MNIIIIDFSKLKEISYRGVRRAAAFVGLGVNVARDGEFKKYQLSEYSALRLLPDDLNDESISHIKEEFEKWVILDGVRELVESFGLFLDQVHSVCLLMATQKKLISSDDAAKFGPAFEWKGVEGKLSILRNRFKISSDKEIYFSSINQVRNCITHRKGLIGPVDLRGNKTFQLTWWGFDIFAETASGKRHSLMPPLPKEGLLLKEGGQIMIQVKDRIIEYKLGDIVTLSPNELIEICYLVQLTTDDIVKASYEYAKEIGIEEDSIAKSDEQKNPDDVD